MESNNGNLAGVPELAAQIISAYVGNNRVEREELAGLIASVSDALARVARGAQEPVAPAPLIPAVPVKKSVTDDYIVSLENGQKFKSLRRHLMTNYGLTPDAYRQKWGLPADYPMVAPNYAAARSALARSSGLGRKRNDEDVETTPAEVDAAPEASAKALKKRAPRKAREEV